MAEVLWVNAAREQYPVRARDCLRRDEVKERHAERRHIMDAQRVRDDEIDILVDLSGHCALSGLPVLMYRPAPVQLSGIGYVHATGMETVDGFLADSCTALWAYLAGWDGLYGQPVQLRSQFYYVRDETLPSALHKSLRSMLRASVAGDPLRYTRLFERKVLALWEEKQQGMEKK